MIESVFYVAHAARSHENAADPHAASRESLRETLAHAARILRYKEIGVTDNTVVPLPAPIVDRTRAVHELFPRFETIDRPLHEMRLLYHLAERHGRDLRGALTRDLDELGPESLYARLGLVLSYVTSIPRHYPASDDPFEPLGTIDLLVLAHEATRSGDRTFAMQEIERYAPDAERNLRSIASFDGYCEAASEGFAFGRLAVAARMAEQLDHVAAVLGRSDDASYLRIDGGRFVAPFRPERSRRSRS